MSLFAIVLRRNCCHSCLLCFVCVVQFAAQEEKRQKNERLHQHQKHENQMRDLQLHCDSNVRELQQLQVGLEHCNIIRSCTLSYRCAMISIELGDDKVSLFDSSGFIMRQHVHNTTPATATSVPD